MHVVRHQVTLHHARIRLLRQLLEYLSKMSP